MVTYAMRPRLSAAVRQASPSPTPTASPCSCTSPPGWSAPTTKARRWAAVLLLRNAGDSDRSRGGGNRMLGGVMTLPRWRWRLQWLRCYAQRGSARQSKGHTPPPAQHRML